MVSMKGQPQQQQGVGGVNQQGQQLVGGAQGGQRRGRAVNQRYTA